jgi:hypothetical protein
MRAHGLQELVVVRRISGYQEVRLQTFNRKDPAHVTQDIAIRGLRKHRMNCPIVGQSLGVRAAGGLRKFLLHGQRRKTHLHSSDSKNKGRRSRFITVRICCDSTAGARRRTDMPVWRPSRIILDRRRNGVARTNIKRLAC